jgi:hypothetical protein
MFQVECLFVDGVPWNEEVEVGRIPEININCLEDCLLSVTVVSWKKKVCWRAIIFYSEGIGINITILPYD